MSTHNIDILDRIIKIMERPNLKERRGKDLNGEPEYIICIEGAGIRAIEIYNVFREYGFKQ